MAFKWGSIDLQIGLEFPPSNGFKEVYYRSSSRANGQRNIRCFPTCSPQHNDKNFCGRPVRALVHLYSDKETLSRINFDSVCCVGEYKPQEATFCIPGPINGEALQSIVRPKPSNQRSTYWGRLIESTTMDVQDDRAHIKGIFEFNTELRGWSYAWHGTRFRGAAKHVFAVTVVMLDRTTVTKPLKPLWPFNLGMDFRTDQFVPIAYFDSPAFTFGSFRERPEMAMTDIMAYGKTANPPAVELPEDYDPQADPQLLGLPASVFPSSICSACSTARALPTDVVAEMSALGVSMEDLQLRLRSLGPESVLSRFVRAAPDLQALHSHKRRLESVVHAAHIKAEYQAIHDYFHRLQLLHDTFDADPVRRGLLDANAHRATVPFPYRPSHAFLDFVDELLADSDASEQTHLLHDLLSLSLVFPVAVEPAIYFLQTLRTPVIVDPHCFSRGNTLQPLASQPGVLPLGAFNRAATTMKEGEGLASQCSIERLLPLLSLPSMSSECSLGVSGAGTFVPLQPRNGSLLTMQTEPPAPPSQTSILTESPSGAWLVLRMVAEYYCHQDDQPGAPAVTPIGELSSSASPKRQRL